jgi:hypothetical protein
MTARMFKNADEAASELLRKGFKRTDSDPDYPFELVESDGVGMKARLEWSERHQNYVVVVPLGEATAATWRP